MNIQVDSRVRGNDAGPGVDDRATTRAMAVADGLWRRRERA
jgi:hypothetical protein